MSDEKSNIRPIETLLKLAYDKNFSVMNDDEIEVVIEERAKQIAKDNGYYQKQKAISDALNIMSESLLNESKKTSNINEITSRSISDNENIIEKNKKYLNNVIEATK